MTLLLMSLEALLGTCNVLSLQQMETRLSKTYMSLGLTRSAPAEPVSNCQSLSLVWPTLPVAGSSTRRGKIPGTALIQGLTGVGIKCSGCLTPQLGWLRAPRDTLIPRESCQDEIATHLIGNWLCNTRFLGFPWPCPFYFLTSVFTISRTTSQINNLHLNSCFLDLFCNLVWPDSRFLKIFSESYEDMVLLFYLPVIPVCLLFLKLLRCTFCVSNIIKWKRCLSI